MNPTPETSDAVEELYERGSIRQSWVWTCDDCVDRALAEDDVDLIGESTGDCDSVHEARLAMLEHNAARHP
jgi:hypothetical protein